VETFDNETSVSEDQHYLLQEQLSKYVKRVQDNVMRLSGLGEVGAVRLFGGNIRMRRASELSREEIRVRLAGVRVVLHASLLKLRMIESQDSSPELKIAELQLERLLAVQPKVEAAGLDVLRSVATYHSRLAALSESLSNVKTRKTDLTSKKSSVEAELAKQSDSEAAKLQMGGITGELEAVEKEVNDLTDEHTACAMEMKNYIESSEADGVKVREESESLIHQCVALEAEITNRTSAVTPGDVSRTTVVSPFLFEPLDFLRYVLLGLIWCDLVLLSDMFRV
jgi:chromosome segregation ATPase